MKNLAHLVGRSVAWKSEGDPYKITRVSGNMFWVEYQGKEYNHGYTWNDEWHYLVPLKIYEEFEKAKELMLKDDDYIFICWALCSVNTGINFSVNSEFNQKTWTDFDKNPSPAGKIIKDRLDGHNTLQDWIINKVGFTVFSKETGSTKSMRLTRLAWLDSLIAEFKAKNE